MSLRTVTPNSISKSIKYNPQNNKLLTLAAGCFWGTQHIYLKHFGNRILDTKVGYSNGFSDALKAGQIDYKRVCEGDTNFAEVLQISYDPSVVSLKELVDFFFRIHDPTTANAQGPDVGTQYRSGLFAHSADDLNELSRLKEAWQPKWNNAIVTEVALVQDFIDAEEYHQLYLKNNPSGYQCPTHFVRDI